MRKYFILNSILALLLVYVYGCGDKKDDNKTGDNKTNSEFVKKDSVTGKQVVQLKYVVKKGDKFFYKMVAKTSNMEKSPATENKEVKQDNEINYYYQKEVDNVDASGIITYKITFDSINITSTMGEQSVKYNSNVNDSVKQNPAFIQYNAVIANPFFTRVSAYGEITDVYGMEKIYEHLFKALGDTLKEKDKEEIKRSFGEESIKEILQQEYQVCPQGPVAIDSSWVKAFNTSVLFFEVVNNAKYTMKSVEDKNSQQIANIEAALVVEFKNKEVNENGMKVKVENAETSGSGKISLNLTRGCIQNKETMTNLKLELKLSAQGQSANSTQAVSTNLYVTLLN
ncbi:MAG: hypothetical protein IT280_06220 [Ignavibacteria bacterium]|nr:hypothetical protein [Ignavibacteria bacterium]